MPTKPTHVTAIVLCGGQAQRLGGIDKCLEPINGAAMIDRVLRRLASQVDKIVISANRNLASYRERGWPVCQDLPSALPGPLAGVASCLQRVSSERVQLCAGDTPDLPEDLVQRLLASGPRYPDDGQHGHYLHAQIQRGDIDQLRQGPPPRSVAAWLTSLGAKPVDFSDAATCFQNINDPSDLALARKRLT